MIASRQSVRVCRSLFAAAMIVSTANAATIGFAKAHDGRCGRASWYALHSITASGERMNPTKLTAAHRKLGFGTRLKVVNERNGRTVVVRINDRGPFIGGRVLDLSKAAAHKLGFIGAGVAKICYEVVG